MTTSANVIEYTIYKDGKEVGNFRKHMMCRLPDYSDLLKYQPLKNIPYFLGVMMKKRMNGKTRK